MEKREREVVEGRLHDINLAAMYRFFAASMEFPAAAWLTPEHRSFLHAVLTDLGMQEEAALLPSAADHLEALQIEYTRLFVNAIPSVIAPPYGSVYLDPERLLFGPSAEKAKAFYREHGYELAGAGDIPDHLVHELRFLALLLEEGKREAAAEFLARFFRPWFGLFCERVIREARQPYYRVLVQLIDFFTREEEENGI